MKGRYNPFKPNSPVYTGMFAGRLSETDRIDEILNQTKLGNPSYILIIGERGRGIGKSSLLLVANHFAKGTLTWEHQEHNFLTVQVSVNDDTSLIDLARKINTGINRELEKSESAIAFCKKTWMFLQKIEIAGTKYRDEKQDQNTQEIGDNLSLSIADTFNAITNSSKLTDLGLRKQKDGIVILIDEADNTSKKLNLGAFLKNLSETLTKEGCENVLVILAGLPRLRENLRESHPSSLRLFEELELSQLSSNEVEDVIKRGLKESNDKHASEEPVNVSDDAIKHIATFSEGYPHFVQQIGYSSFNVNTDNIIDENDVQNAILSKGGAIDLIGDKYYKDLYFNRINVDSYRQIPNIMAEKWNKWISKKEIEKDFKGKPSALDNGLKALRDRNIILSKPGARGQYRLQWRSFALWIKLFTSQK